MPVVSAANPPYTGVPSVEPAIGAPSRFDTSRASALDFGAGIGQALEGLGGKIDKAGDVLADAAIRQQQLINQTTADNATNSYLEQEKKLLRGDPNVPGDTGFFGKRGQAAVDAFPKTWDAISQLRGQFRNGLENDRQKLAFDNETRRLQSMTLDRMGTHYDNEFKNFAIATATAKSANADSALGEALATDNDAGAQNAVRMKMQAELTKLQVLGQDHDPDIVNATLQKVRGGFVKEKVEALSQKNPYAALKYLEANSDAVVGDEYNQLNKSLRTRAGAVQAQIDAGLAPPLPGAKNTDLGNSDHILDKYAVGNAMPNGPSSVNNVQREFAVRVDNMVKDMPPEIAQKFAIESGFRDAAREVQVYKEQHSGEKVPENSYHSHGIAMDVTKDPAVLNWINQNGPQYGVGFPIKGIPGEENHLEPLENGQRIPENKIAGWIGQYSTPKTPDVVDSPNVKSNNFGGIRKAGTERGPSEGGFETYPTPAAGVKAVAEQLKRYASGGVVTAMNPQGKPLDTLRGIVTTWAPPGQNDTALLIQRASQVTGFGPDQQISLSDPDTLSKVVEATIRNENGGKLPVAPQVISQVAQATAAVDTLIPPKLNFPLPPLEQGEAPDAQVPGMAAGIRHINETVPKDDPERFTAAVKALRTARNAEYQQFQQNERLAKQKVDEIDNAAQSSYIARMAPGAANPPTIAEIMKDPQLKPASAKGLVQFYNAELKRDPIDAIDADNSTALFMGIHKPYGDPQRINTIDAIQQAYADKLIKKDTYNFLAKEFKDTRTPDGETMSKYKKELVDTVKPLIEGPIKGATAYQDAQDLQAGRLTAKQRLASFTHALDAKITEYSAAGKDWRVLFNPGTLNKPNPEYLGGKDNLSGYISKPTPPAAAPVEHGAIYRFFHAPEPADMAQDDLIVFGKANGTNYPRAAAEIQRRIDAGTWK